MNELIKLLIEWARNNKHWPLILAVAIIPWFWFCQLVFELRFRDTLFHWSFLMGAGVICVISGMLDWAIIWRRWQRLWSSGPLAIVGASLFVAGVLRVQPPIIPPLPDDKLVVTIASFTSDNADITRLLISTLQQKQREGAPLKVNKIGKEVPGSDDDEKKEAAISLGKSKESNAHVVLWGEVITITEGDKRKFRVPGGLTVANEWQKADVEGALATFSPDIPFTICSNSTQEIAESLTEIVTIILGVAHYRVQKWDEAARILQTANSGEGRLYEGLCYFRKAQQPSQQRQQNLLAAIRVYQEVMAGIETENRMFGHGAGCGSDSPAKQQLEKNRLRAKAYFLLGDANLRMGIGGQRVQTYLQDAVQNYNAALNGDADIQPRWAVENNLGVALFELAKMSRENLMRDYVQQAVDAYRNAAKDCAGQDEKEAAQRNCALVHNSLGSALAFWSASADGDRRQSILRDAEKELKLALDFYDQEKLSKDWAMVQSNYAGVMVEKSKKAPVEQRDDADLVRAVEAYRAILGVYDREAEPEKYATVQNNLGTALYGLWKHKQGERDLQDALAAFRTAVEIRGTTNGPLQALASSERGLANTLTELGKRAGGADRAAYRTEAILSFDKALAFYTKENYPQKYQEIVDEKKDAVSL